VFAKLHFFLVFFVFFVFSRLLGDGALFVTILRRPSRAFESLYNYARLDRFYNESLPDYILR